MNNGSAPRGYRDPWDLAGKPHDTPLAVALSGGADSVALLALVAGAGTVRAVHVHHGIRGAEADRDEAFCREIAAALGVPLSVLHIDVPALAAARGEGMETAARNARYAALEAWCAAEGIPLLATAHHADDQLETVLQNLLRGAGTRGLSGIPVCRSLGAALVVRPLLRVPRADLRAYLAARDLPFVTDSTNDEPFCRRNRLRAEVLPALGRIEPHAAAHAAQSAAALAEDEAYFTDLAAAFLRNEGDRPRLSALAALPRPVRTRVWRLWLPARPAAAHIAALEGLLADPAPHKALSLPDCRVSAENGRLCVQKNVGIQTGNVHFDVPLAVGETAFPHDGVAVYLSKKDEPPADFSSNLFTYHAKCSLSARTIKGCLSVRTRRAGDRILSGGMHKEVRKLPAWRPFSPETRARVPLLADAEGVLAVPYGPVRDGCGGSDLFVFFQFN